MIQIATKINLLHGKKWYHKVAKNKIANNMNNINYFDGNRRKLGNLLCHLLSPRMRSFLEPYVNVKGFIYRDIRWKIRNFIYHLLSHFSHPSSVIFSWTICECWMFCSSKFLRKRILSTTYYLIFSRPSSVIFPQTMWMSNDLCIKYSMKDKKSYLSLIILFFMLLEFDLFSEPCVNVRCFFSIKISEERREILYIT